MFRSVLFFAFVACGFPLSALADFNSYFELGLSGNYRKTFLTDTTTDERAYDQSSAYVASFAYYFREMTALEFSYSQGSNRRYIPSSTITSTTTHKYTLYGADLIFTFGTRQDRWIPYIKAGVSYFDRKSIEYQYIDNSTGLPLPTEPVELRAAVVPSGGFGMQFRISNQLSFKFGIDVWTSGAINKKVKDFDWAGRIGISWFL
ncbi:MAG: outer membrane beta-barrel protein [Bdellovibrionaceae bacterium]|nr:outer membrane beta-barrel protein [Pseudobdellovibrionaceae bacterium]